MFVGTGSDVGKSVLSAGFCRILLQDGYNPAPFKAQNMSLNSYVTPEGGELGRAQAVQAEACKIPCHTDMNPVLLKPNHDTNSQVILNGKVFGNYSAKSYFRKENKQIFWKESLAAFHRLAVRYNPIVLEGAGSISELNLKETDIVNMPMAVATQSTTILVADIDRGGVFAAVYGSIMLLTPEERKRIKAIIINKFRGDISLFTKGKQMLEDLIRIPVLAVIPYYSDIYIEEEDSVALEKRYKSLQTDKVNIAVIALERMSNFTDFDSLAHDLRTNLFFTKDKEDISKADIIILPGSKNTISDLKAIKNSGIDNEIIKAFKIGKPVIGICGGYQIMGEKIADPNAVESADAQELSGLGILPIKTIIEEAKTTKQTEFQYRHSAKMCKGYEIHMGNSQLSGKAQNLNLLPNGKSEGCLVRNNCWGTYMHGILDNDVVIDDLLSPFAKSNDKTMNYDEFKQLQYDKLATHIRKYCDMDKFYEIINQ